VGQRQRTLEGVDVIVGASLRGRRVLVTGHTGFKGSWLCAWLKHVGADVVGFSLPAATDSLFVAAQLSTITTHLEGDVRDEDRLSQVVAEHRPEVVLHLAAQALVRPSYDEPVATFATNVMGTAHLLEACRRQPSVRAIVVVTTDKVYENREWPWGYREADALGGHDPYSSSKAAAELVTTSYRRSFFGGGPAVATARAGNVIGGGDWSKDRILPDIVRAVQAGVPARIRNPAAVRPWQHVLEPLAGYLLLAERLLGTPTEAIHSVNFGPRDEGAVPVLTLAERFVAGLGRGSLDVQAIDPNAPKETMTLRLDATLARAQLGWRPMMSVHDAVDWTASWYREVLDDPSAAGSMMQRQLDRYVALLSSSSQL
jgi:CDP-glucose 4,6-dehydratase